MLIHSGFLFDMSTFLFKCQMVMICTSTCVRVRIRYNVYKSLFFVAMSDSSVESLGNISIFCRFPSLSIWLKCFLSFRLQILLHAKAMMDL